MFYLIEEKVLLVMMKLNFLLLYFSFILLTNMYIPVLNILASVQQVFQPYLNTQVVEKSQDVFICRRETWELFSRSRYIRCREYMVIK